MRHRAEEASFTVQSPELSFLASIVLMAFNDLDTGTEADRFESVQFFLGRSPERRDYRRMLFSLPETEKQALLSEMQSVEYAETSAGNLTLRAGGKGHHADRFSALCFALINETHLQSQPFEVRKVSGYF